MKEKIMEKAIFSKGGSDEVNDGQGFFIGLGMIDGDGGSATIEDATAL